MADYSARELLAANLARLMEETPALDTPEKLSRVCVWPAGKKKGERVAPRTIRYVLDQRPDTEPPRPSPSLDLIIALATAFKVQTWELLVDDEQARRWIMARILTGTAAPDARVERALPAPPKTSAAKHRRRSSST